MSDNAMTPQKRDRWIPWMIVLFFVVIAIIDGIMVTIAVRTQPGVVTPHAYEEGLAYNKTLEAAAQQERLGWNGAIAYENGILSFDLRDKDGKAIEGAQVHARLIRPVQNGYDFDIKLARAGAGRYIVKTGFPLDGRWEARVFAKWQDNQYQSSKMLMVR